MQVKLVRADVARVREEIRSVLALRLGDDELVPSLSLSLSLALSLSLSRSLSLLTSSGL